MENNKDILSLETEEFLDQLYSKNNDLLILCKDNKSFKLVLDRLSVLLKEDNTYKKLILNNRNYDRIKETDFKSAMFPLIINISISSSRIDNKNNTNFLSNKYIVREISCNGWCGDIIKRLYYIFNITLTPGLTVPNIIKINEVNSISKIEEYKKNLLKL